MIDIFLHNDVTKLLKNKNVVFIGDSNIRAMYKDMLCLSQNTTFISQKILKTKMENSCFGDRLLTHGPKNNGRKYREEREAHVKETKISFFFITRVYESYVEDILRSLEHKSNLPDVLIINSCLWDITRWGPSGVENYQNNLGRLMLELKRFPDCLVIWITAPPIACEVKGGFLLKELAFLKYSLRFHVMEANNYARNVVVRHGFDLIDSHYHLRMQLHRRSEDGIHWMPSAVRYMTNLLLTHISLAWNIPLPHRYQTLEIQENLNSSTTEDIVATSNSSSQQNEPKLSSVIGKPPKKKQEKENSQQQRKKKKYSSFSKHLYVERQKRIRTWRHDNSYTAPDNYYNWHESGNYNWHDSGNYNWHDSGNYYNPRPLLPSPNYYNPSLPTTFSFQNDDRFQNFDFTSNNLSFGFQF